jgi:hypothetical protein
MKIRNIAVILISVLLVSCGPLECEIDSEKAIFIKALPQQRFEKLYEYSITLDVEPFDQDYFDLTKTPLPEEISDLPIKIVRIKERQVLYRLAGCMDHHLDLVVMKSGNNAPRIELRSGEVPRIIEVLWRNEN